MNKNLKLYPQGFIFSEITIHNLPEHFNFKKVVDKFNYYYDESIKPFTFEIDDKFIIIHGHFIYVGEEISTDLDLLSYLLDAYWNDFESYLEILDFIGGRYAVVIGNKNHVEVFQDAAGTRSVYFSTDNNALSSHVHLLTDNFECKNDEWVEKYNGLKNFSTFTPYENIKSMVPNFSLNFYTKDIKRFFPRRDNKYKDFTENEKFEIIETCWSKQFKYFNNEFDSILHSISGGFDSRVSLALSKSFIDEIQFFTYTLSRKNINSNKRFQKTLDTDKLIVNTILKDISLKHDFLYFADEKLHLNHEQSNILSKNTINQHGWALIPHYLKTFTNGKHVHIRNNVTAICKSPYITNPQGGTPNDLKQRIHRSLKVEQNQAGSGNLENLINEEIATLGYENDLYGFDALDLYYLEVRLGRWHAEVLNETDIVYETANPYNVRAMIEASLAFPKGKRIENYISTELINRNYSILNFYGKNTILNMYEQSKKDNINKDINNLNNYFNEFTIFDDERNYVTTVPSNKNTLLLPKEFLLKDFYSEIFFTFNKTRGIVQIDLYNQYNAQKGDGYLCYEIFKNDILLLTEDISKWGMINNINIMNMSKDDKVKIVVRTIKTCTTSAWEKASKISIKNYKEAYTKTFSEQEITCTSPYSILK